MGMGTWLITSPPILGYQDQAMITNDHDQRRFGVFVGGVIAVADDGVGAHRQRGGRAMAVVRAPGVLDAKRFGLSQRYPGGFTW